MLPTTNQKVRNDENQPKDRDCEGSCGYDVDTCEPKDKRFNQRPNRKGSSRVEISGNVPRTSLEMADCSVTVPAFVGIFRPVHPWRMIGEVGSKVCRMEPEEDRSNKDQKKFADLSRYMGLSRMCFR